MRNRFRSHLSFANVLHVGAHRDAKRQPGVRKRCRVRRTTITFNHYQAMNARSQPGQCIFGGSFVVK